MKIQASITIPYAVANYADLRDRGFYYVDKTDYIPRLEGVPTVVDAATLANDTIDRMLDTIDSLGHTILDRISSQDRYDMIQQILDPYTENMFVTPKEVDEVTDNLANIIANGINIAIQPPIENDDINKYK